MKVASEGGVEQQCATRKPASDKYPGLSEHTNRHTQSAMFAMYVCCRCRRVCAEAIVYADALHIWSSAGEKNQSEALKERNEKTTLNSIVRELSTFRFG